MINLSDVYRALRAEAEAALSSAHAEHVRSAAYRRSLTSDFLSLAADLVEAVHNGTELDVTTDRLLDAIEAIRHTRGLLED